MMSICINPNCPNAHNPDNILFCQACGSELLLEGRYRVASILGGGGFGKTYAVRDARINTLKVLKVLINNHPKAVELFQREAEVLVQLNHPGVPKVEPDSYFIYFPRNNQQPLYCLVMEKIEGLDLQEYLKQRDYRPIEQKLALQWLTEIVGILQQVHSQNFFHRDIKPSNIMLRADGHLTLIDFGTARAVTGTYMAKQAVGKVTGVISPGYTPTEQMNGQAVPQSDFFALGRTFVYLLTGKEPSDPAIYDAYADELRWQNLTTTNLLQPLAELLDQMMARLPSQRPQNTQVILQKLAEIHTYSQPIPPTELTPPPEPPKGWTRRRLIKVAGFGGIGLVGSFLLYRCFPKNKSLLTVSSIGEGDYKTISEAIASAEPGARIVVRPGTYQESLILNKPLTIVGDGQTTQNIIIESTNASCIFMQTEQAEVSGLTLRGQIETNQKYFTVDIPQGQLVLTNCDITSNSLSCVGIYGSTANPIIQGCQIHDSKEDGILIYKQAQGRVENCNIFSNSLSGVEIREGANPLIQGCKIHNGKEGGVLIDQNGQGSVKDCDIYSNALPGVEIREGANPVIQGCQIRDGTTTGLLVHKNGLGTVEDSSIFGNKYSGVESREGGNPTIQRCNINQNQQYAVYIHDNGKATVENCNLVGNMSGVFSIDATSVVQRSGNTPIDTIKK
jgi:parallel beta-helix repeat protein